MLKTYLDEVKVIRSTFSWIASLE